MLVLQFFCLVAVGKSVFSKDPFEICSICEISMGIVGLFDSISLL
jgi:hypothetical protein